MTTVNQKRLPFPKKYCRTPSNTAITQKFLLKFLVKTEVAKKYCRTPSKTAVPQKGCRNPKKGLPYQKKKAPIHSLEWMESLFWGVPLP